MQTDGGLGFRPFCLRSHIAAWHTLQLSHEKKGRTCLRPPLLSASRALYTIDSAAPSICSSPSCEIGR